MLATACRPSAVPGPDEGITSALEEVLRRVWGFAEFRPLQLAAMGAILERRDSVVVLPTGGGKSVCFQAPALVRPGLGVVVSPLISLMKDQVDGLLSAGVKAALFNSTLTGAERDRVAAGLRAGRYRLLYVAPERLAGEGSGGFARLLQEAGPAFFAVDEAHCISEWGHDFRPEYRQLGALRERFPEASIHAFTATATPRVRGDIAHALGLREPLVLVGAVDRPNLIYRARRRAHPRLQIRDALQRHRGEAAIVYAISRREVEELAADLREAGFAALPYHAGLEDRDRARHQEAFADERCEVIVATVAFGMGIDRSNVRCVLHAGAPRSLEHYLQESGRAGRDGLEAECLLLYSPADFLKWRRLMEASGELREESRTQLREVERYALSTGCRHRALAAHFGEALAAGPCGACDRCLGELERAPEPLVVAQKILSCVLRVRESYGAGHVVDVLRGQASEKVAARGHQSLSTFGLLQGVAAEEVHGYVEQLVGQGFLASSGEPYPVLRVSDSGRRLLRGEGSLELVRQAPPPARPRRRAGGAPPPAAGAMAAVDTADGALGEQLRTLRRELARERGVPPYVLFHDTTLRDLVAKKPRTAAELREVHGIGERKAIDLGPLLLEVIARHLEGAAASG